MPPIFAQFARHASVVGACWREISFAPLTVQDTLTAIKLGLQNGKTD